jgi:hypothetical protein
VEVERRILVKGGRRIWGSCSCHRTKAQEEGMWIRGEDKFQTSINDMFLFDFLKVCFS